MVYRDLEWDDLLNLQRNPLSVAMEFRAECEREAETFPAPENGEYRGNFRIGDEVVYWCEESHPVAGTHRKNGVADNVAKVVYRVTGEEWEGDSRLIWLEITHQSPGLWVSFPAETGKNTLPQYIALPQCVQFTVLMDLSDRINIRRYFFKINQEPSCEFVGYNGESLLAPCSLNELFLPVTPALRETISEEIPLWGWVESRWETSACSYRLSLLASRVGTGNPAWKSPSADVVFSIDDRIRLATYSPKRLAGRGNGYGGGLYESLYDRSDYSRIPELIATGFNQVIGTVINDDLFDGKKSVQDRMQLYRDFCLYVRNAPVFFGVDFINLVRRSDRFRANFIGSKPHLDEPIVYFEAGLKTRLPQWKRENRLIQLQDEAEKDRKGEREQSAVLTGEFQESADKYIDFITELCYPLWEGDAPLSFNYPASLAWYDVQGGSSGFIRQYLGKYVFQEVAFLNYLGTGIEYNLENNIRLSCAFMRAAGCPSVSWGPGLYLGTPLEYRVDVMQRFYDEGARFFFLWSWYGDSDIEPAQAMDLAREMWDYVDYTERDPETIPESDCIILLPYGLYMPPVNYYSRKYHPYADRFGMLNEPEAIWKGYEELTGITAALTNRKTVRDLWMTAGKVIAEKLESGKRFDIGIMTDLPEEYYRQQYDEIIYIR